MQIEEMVEELNNYCEGSLSIISYYGGWEVHSYEEETPFQSGKNFVWGETFKEAITKAYKIMQKSRPTDTKALS